MPAFDTRISTLPRSFIAFSTPASTPASSVTSMTSAVAFTPRALISSAAACAAAGLMSAIAMRAPLSANTSAMRLPMPLAAPVIRATLFFTLIEFSLSFVARNGFHVDAQIAQFAIQMCPFHAHCLGQFAHAAADLLELAQQVGAFELLARFAQRQVEIDSGAVAAHDA